MRLIIRSIGNNDRDAFSTVLATMKIDAFSRVLEAMRETLF
jgi:hypothetical protein